MNTKSIVSTQYSGRLCNNVLQTYRAFWFAYTHDIPFSNVVLGAGTPCAVHAIFDKVRGHFIPDGDVARYKFDIVYNCWPKTRDMRKELAELDVSDGRNITFWASSFIYPELPWEYALFAALFDNQALRSNIAKRYAGVLCGNTVGYTIRRGETVALPWVATPDENSIVSDLSGVVHKFRGMVRILIATDDLAFVRVLLARHSELRRNVYLITESEDVTLYLLSLCDYVVSNREMQTRCCWYDDAEHANATMFTSTFGQTAQVLSKAYKYKDMATDQMDPTASVPVCGTCKVANVHTQAAMSALSELHRYGPCQLPYPVMHSEFHKKDPSSTTPDRVVSDTRPARAK